MIKKIILLFLILILSFQFVFADNSQQAYDRADVIETIIKSGYYDPSAEYVVGYSDRYGHYWYTQGKTDGNGNFLPGSRLIEIQRDEKGAFRKITSNYVTDKVGFSGGQGFTYRMNKEGDELGQSGHSYTSAIAWKVASKKKGGAITKSPVLPDNLDFDIPWGFGGSSPDGSTDSGDSGNGSDWGGLFGWIGKIFNAIVSLPEKIINRLKDLFKWAFYIDFSKISEKLNFQEKLESKFKIFFDISNKFKNLSSGGIENGVISMNLPHFLGGQKVNILDLTIVKPLLDWGKVFIKFALWISFANWLLKLFEPRFGIN